MLSKEDSRQRVDAQNPDILLTTKKNTITKTRYREQKGIVEDYGSQQVQQNKIQVFPDP